MMVAVVEVIMTVIDGDDDKDCSVHRESGRHTPTLDFLIPGYKHCLPERLLSLAGSCRL